MPDQALIALAPLRTRDVTVLRRMARTKRETPELIADLLRTQLLIAVMRSTLEGEVIEGLLAGERSLLLDLFSRPACDSEQLLLRAAISRCASTGDDNLTAMMAASLEADCMRLGMMQDAWAGRDPVWQ